MKLTEESTGPSIVDGEGIEPTSPKEQIYSLPHPSNCAAHPGVLKDLDIR